MSRYINADNLIKKMQEQYNDLLNKDGYYDNFTQGYGDALSTVENEPTADVQKVKHGHWACLGWGEWLEEAKEVLEKQTPKKITHTATLKTSCTCPNCGNCLDKFEKFGESIVRVKHQYCHFCGQALDWSDI